MTRQFPNAAEGARLVVNRKAVDKSYCGQLSNDGEWQKCSGTLGAGGRLIRDLRFCISEGDYGGEIVWL